MIILAIILIIMQTYIRMITRMIIFNSWSSNHLKYDQKYVVTSTEALHHGTSGVPTWVTHDAKPRWYFITEAFQIVIPVSFKGYRFVYVCVVFFCDVGYLNKVAFQSKTQLLLTDRKSDTYNLTLEWPWPGDNLDLVYDLHLRHVKPS